MVKYRQEGKKSVGMLVRGIDAFGYWDQEPTTEMDFDPAMFDPNSGYNPNKPSGKR